MSLSRGLVILLCLLFSAASALASETVRRHALAAEANHEGADRPTLEELRHRVASPHGSPKEKPVVVRRRQEVRRQFEGLNGRHGFGLAFGFWDCGGSLADPAPATEYKVNSLGGGIVYSHWFHESMAVTFNMTGHVVELETGLDESETGSHDRGTFIASTLVGARWYPAPPSQFRPYVTSSIGPFIGTRIEAGPEHTRSITTGAVGGQVGGGFDAQIGRSFMIGVLAGYNFVADFPTPLAGKDNFSGFTTRVELSFLWGKGRMPGN